MKLLTGDVLLKIPNSNPFHTPLIYCAVKSCPWIIDVWIPLTGGFYCGILFLSCSFNLVGWLEDAAYFAAIDDSLNTFSWYLWPESLKNRHLAALEEIYQSKKDFVSTGFSFFSFLRILSESFIIFIGY